MDAWMDWLRDLPGLEAFMADPLLAERGVEFETEDGLVRIEPCGRFDEIRLGFMVEALDPQAAWAADLLLDLHEFNAQARWSHDGWVTMDESDQLWLNLIVPIAEARALTLDRLLRVGFDSANRMVDLVREPVHDRRRAGFQALQGGLVR
jgi:hypothetical protein